MKTLVINGISARRGGGQTNLINLMEYLPKYESKVIFILNSSNVSVFDTYKSAQISTFEAKFASKSILHRIYWEKFILPKKLVEWDADIYYAPGGTMTVKVPSKCTAITTLQNMLPFEDIERQRFPLFSYLRYKLLLLRFVFLKSYNLSDKIIFISKYSRNVVKKYIPNIEEKSTIIPLGISESFLTSEDVYVLPPNIQENNFYMYVSNLDYYKAQKELIYSWKKLVDSGYTDQLVLVGPNVGNYGNEVLELIDSLALKQYVIYLGPIDYTKLPSLYKMSKALIFASSCECCPNILLEMMSFGKPLFCSEKQPMPEFAEDGAIYFNPYSDTSLVEKVINTSKDTRIIKSEQACILSKKYSYNETIIKNIEYILDIEK